MLHRAPSSHRLAVPRRRRSRRAAAHDACYARALDVSGRCGSVRARRRARRRSSRSARLVDDVRGDRHASFRRAATATTRSGRAAIFALLAFERFGEAADRRTAERLLNQLQARIPVELAHQPIDEALGRRRRRRGRRPVSSAKPLPRADRASWPVARPAPELAGQQPPMHRICRVQTAGDTLPGTAPRRRAAAARRHDPGRSSSAISSARASKAASGSRSRWTASHLTTPSSSSSPRRVFFDLEGHAADPRRCSTRRSSSTTTSCARSGSAAIRRTRRASCSTCKGVESYSVFTLYNPFRW